MTRTFAAVFAQRSQANAIPDNGKDSACQTRLPASVAQEPPSREAGRPPWGRQKSVPSHRCSSVQIRVQIASLCALRVFAVVFGCGRKAALSLGVPRPCDSGDAAFFPTSAIFGNETFTGGRLLGGVAIFPVSQSPFRRFPSESAAPFLATGDVNSPLQSQSGPRFSESVGTSAAQPRLLSLKSKNAMRFSISVSESSGQFCF